MGPARTLFVISLVLLFASGPAPAAAQASPFDQVARRVLALKVRTEIMRSRAQDGWQAAAWTDSLVAMGGDLERLDADARRLDRDTVEVAPQLVALVERVRVALETLARAQDQRSARMALAHLSAG